MTDRTVRPVIRPDVRPDVAFAHASPSGAVAVGGGGGDPAILLESGDYLLLESGDRILLE